MPGQLKEVRSRITSVNSTQQITKAMKMVSAAKLRRAQDRITQMRPYSQKLSEMLGHIVTGEATIEIKLATERPVNKVLVVLMTSDRGLCGGFNSNLIKTTRQLINGQYAEYAKNGNLEIMCIGKKGADALKRIYKVNDNHIGLFTGLSFASSANVAEEIMKAFENGTYDKVDIVYAQFKNAATQIFQVEPFLPVAKATPAGEGNKENNEFIYQPSKDTLINELVPRILKTQFFKCLADTNASEHGARMTAMDKATDNANDLLKQLRITYNRARQAAITTELTEIVSGAAALQG
jgi:F-type H+-transporting ATPase subunit gamma